MEWPKAYDAGSIKYFFVDRKKFMSKFDNVFKSHFENRPFSEKEICHLDIDDTNFILPPFQNKKQLIKVDS